MKEIELPSGISVVSSFDKKIRNKIDVNGSIEAIEKLRNEQSKRQIVQSSAHVKISTNDPILLQFSSDEHVGNIDTPHDKVLQSLRLVQNTRNMFTGFGGDFVDQLSWTRESGIHQVSTEVMQGELCREMLMQTAGKILYYLSSNHDAFVRNFNEANMDDMPFPIVGPNQARIDLEVGSEDYSVFHFHKISMGNSTMSPFLRNQRAYEYLDNSCDIYVGSHEHRNNIAQYQLGGKDRTFIGTGTAKVNDSFQIAQGNVRQAQYGYSRPSVILFPNEHKILPFLNAEDGVEALGAINGLRTVLSASTSNILRASKI